MSRTYPYKAWVIQPSGKPKEVNLIQDAAGTRIFGRRDVTDAGKYYKVEHLHATKEDAIAAGLAAVDSQQAKLDKQQATLDKKRAKLIAAREQP